MAVTNQNKFPTLWPAIEPDIRELESCTYPIQPPLPTAHSSAAFEDWECNSLLSWLKNELSCQTLSFEPSESIDSKACVDACTSTQQFLETHSNCPPGGWMGWPAAACFIATAAAIGLLMLSCWTQKRQARDQPRPPSDSSFAVRGRAPLMPRGSESSHQLDT